MSSKSSQPHAPESIATAAGEGNPKPRRLRLSRRALMLAMVPLWIVVAMPLSFLAALHSPRPHHVRLMLVGPAQVVTPIAHKLSAGGQFSISQTDVVGGARSSVEQRKAAGSILITVHEPAGDTISGSSLTPQKRAAAQHPTFSVNTYVASGGGASVATVIETVGEEAAKSLKTVSTLTDLAPLKHEDGIGIDVFFLLMLSGFGGFLVITVLSQLVPHAKLWSRWKTIATSAIVTPLVALGLMAISVGGYGLSFGSTLALLALDAVYVFTCGSVAILAVECFGEFTIIGVTALVVFLNLPSSGGAQPVGMLPGFWQFIHSFYFGAGALESFRSILYFGGHGISRWLWQLGAWTVASVVLSLLIDQIKTVRAQRRELAVLTPDPNQRRLRAHLLPVAAGANTDVSISEREPIVSITFDAPSGVHQHLPKHSDEHPHLGPRYVLARVESLEETIAENQLDLIAAPHTVDEHRHPPLSVVIAATIALPLVFVLSFSLAFPSAFHKPAPNGFALALAGPSAVTQPFATGLEHQRSGAFKVKQTLSVAEAERWVRERKQSGAIAIHGRQVTSIVASGGAPIAALTVEQVAQQLATKLHGTVSVNDVSPLRASDEVGLAPYYLILVGTVGAYLAVMMLAQSGRNRRPREMVAVSALAGVLVPLISYVLIAAIAGKMGSSFATQCAVIGVAMLYTFTIGLLASFLVLTLNQAAIFLIVILMMALNFPSMGGAIPGAMLSPFWQFMHGIWFGSGALESVRSIVFFHGHQAGRWLLQLLSWTVGGAGLVTLASLRGRRGAAATATGVDVPTDAGAKPAN